MKHTRLQGLQVGRKRYPPHIAPVWDNKVRTEFKMLKGNETTEDKYVEAGNSWDLENATKEAYKLKQTLTKEDIHAIIICKSKVANEANSESLISCKYCGKGHK